MRGHAATHGTQVCLRYYPGAPLALKFISFHIKDKEKVGAQAGWALQHP